MTITTRQLRRYEELKGEAYKAEDRLRKYKHKLSAVCDHPPGYIRSHEEDRDNGYGKWWRVTIKFCVICGAQDSYGNGHFVIPNHTPKDEYK